MCIVRLINIKNISIISFIVAVMICFCNVAFAEEAVSTYEISDLSITVDIPESITVLTPKVKENEEFFKNGMFDYIQTMSKFRDNNDVLYGKDWRGSVEFEISVIPNEDKINNLTTVSAQKQEKLLDEMSKQNDVMNISLYSTENALFIESSKSVTMIQGITFSKEYFTVYDNKNITIKLSSSNTALTNEQLAIVKNVADSFRIPEKKPLVLSEVISKSEVFLFVTLIASFVVIVIYKIKSAKEPKEKKTNSAEQSSIKKENDKQNIADEKINSESQQAQISENSENSQISEKQSAEEDIKSSDSDEFFEEEHYDIDLEAAIANFEEHTERKSRNTRKKK